MPASFAMDNISEVIRKTKKGWTIFSKTGKPLGSYSSRDAAAKRLRQIEFFKHQESEADDALDTLKVTADDLDFLSADQKAEIKNAGKDLDWSGNPPAWVADRSIWRRAKKALEKNWDNYGEPYAVVAWLYQRLGGSVESSASEEWLMRKVYGA